MLPSRCRCSSTLGSCRIKAASAGEISGGGISLDFSRAFVLNGHDAEAPYPRQDSSSKARFFHQDGMDLSGTMHTSDQNLLDVRCPAGASNKNYRPTLAGHPTPGDGVRFEDFLKRGYHLRPSVKGDVDRRSERRKVAANLSENLVQLRQRGDPVGLASHLDQLRLELRQ